MNFLAEGVSSIVREYGDFPAKCNFFFWGLIFSARVLSYIRKRGREDGPAGVEKMELTNSEKQQMTAVAAAQGYTEVVEWDDDQDREGAVYPVLRAWHRTESGGIIVQPDLRYYYLDEAAVASPLDQGGVDYTVPRGRRVEVPSWVSPATGPRIYVHA